MAKKVQDSQEVVLVAVLAKERTERDALEGTTVAKLVDDLGEYLEVA